MKLIVAVCEDWGIGKDGDQPFYIPEDLRQYKEKTMGNVTIMGRKTLEALPKVALKNRISIVLTRDVDFARDDVVVCNDLEQLSQTLMQYDSDSIFVIGGQQIYELLLDRCDTAYVTKIFATADVDRHFPNLDEMSNWRLHGQSEVREYEGLRFCYCEYRKQ
ncbi:MAG: dihydrofolate reductase [Defluviitaleaceae bacterium]|nr:dihydrofolate reductase [Defluviitaleaceae bacterium]